MSNQSVKVRRAQLRLQKKALAIQAAAASGEIIKTALQSPVMSGTIAFLGVHFLENSIKAGALAKSTPSPSGNTVDQRIGQTNTQPPNLGSPLAWWTWFTSLIGGFTPFGAQGGAALGNLASTAIGGVPNAANLFDIFKNLDFAALKAAILLYIASGGNLAGLLQSSGGLIGGFIKSAGLSSLEGAIAG